MKLTNRIEYIDAVRGFTMLMVILGHFEVFTFSAQAFLGTPVYKLIQMPLFFFISGYMAFKNPKEWNTHTFLRESIQKLRFLLIPAFFFGLLFTYFQTSGNFTIFVNDISKQGYWFTIALSEMFLLYYIVNYLLHRIKIANVDKYFVIALFISILMAYLIKILSIYSPIVNDLINITSFYYLPFYFPHFIFGILASKYKPTFEKIIDNSYFMAGALILFSSVLVFRQTMIENIIGGKEISACIVSFTGIVVIYNFFRKYQASFSSSTKLGRTLQYIGKRTLDIYLLHYFFLPYVPKIHHLLGTSPNLVMELIGFLLAFLVIGCCLITSNIIRLSDFLGYWLFGVKKK